MARAAALTSKALECQLTGGYDSRLVAAACVAAGVTPRFMTRGTEDHADVRIAAELCRTLGVAHDVQRETEADIAAGFAAAADRLLTQTDGLVSLWQASDALSRPARIDRLGQTLGGTVGGVRRGVGLKKGYTAAGDDATAVIGWLLARVGESAGGLLRCETVEIARQELHQALSAALTAGVRPRDLGYSDYLTDRMPRWGGSNSRKVEPVRATLPILAARAFLHASFAQTEEEGRRLTLHRRVIGQLAPQLLAVPFDKPMDDAPRTTHRQRRGLWSRLRAALGSHRAAEAEPAGEVGHAGARHRVFARIREAVREQVLDAPSSPVFDLVDRHAFERMTSAELFGATGDPVVPTLYAIATLRRYEDHVLRARPILSGDRSAPGA